MKKILALTLVFGMQYVSANPNGPTEIVPSENNSISVRDYADLGILLTLRYGNGKSILRTISGKNSSACSDEFVGLELLNLTDGLYNILIQRDKPGSASILTNFLGATQPPRTLKTTDGDEKQEGQILFWNRSLQEIPL